jgi:hypothetical protein
MGNAFLAEKKLSFIMKLFHFVCEKQLLNWLLGGLEEKNKKSSDSVCLRKNLFRDIL